MEIKIGNTTKKGFYRMEYKGFNFFRTIDKVWASEQRDNGKWRGLGRAGYEYVVFNDGNALTFDSLKQVKAFINARIACMEAERAMVEIMKGAVMA